MGHLRFMRGYLSSVAPSFSNQEPRAHKLWPEFLPTIQGGMTGERLESVLSLSPSLYPETETVSQLGGAWWQLSLTLGSSWFISSVVPAKMGRSVWSGRTNRWDFVHLLMSCLSGPTLFFLNKDQPDPRNPNQMQHFLNSDTLVWWISIRLFVCLSVSRIPQPWREDFHEIEWRDLCQEQLMQVLWWLVTGTSSIACDTNKKKDLITNSKGKSYWSENLFISCVIDKNALRVAANWSINGGSLL